MAERDPSQRREGNGEVDGPERELEESPIAKRLRTMDWPAAPSGAKERGLDAILERMRESRSDG